jgi:Acetyltransferases
MLPLGLVARQLDSSHAVAIETFCRECIAFFTLVAGEAPSDERSRDLLEARPQSVELTRKHVIGFERAGALVAIVDLLEDYPKASDWYVGLLLLSPDERGRGLGTAIWTAIEQWICAEGGRHARLIVQDQNPNGARFWRALGFIDSGTTTQHLQTRTNLCSCFEKPLLAASLRPGVQ